MSNIYGIFIERVFKGWSRTPPAARCMCSISLYARWNGNTLVIVVAHLWALSRYARWNGNTTIAVASDATMPSSSQNNEETPNTARLSTASSTSMPKTYGNTKIARIEAIRVQANTATKSLIAVLIFLPPKALS